MGPLHRVKTYIIREGLLRASFLCVILNSMGDTILGAGTVSGLRISLFSLDISDSFHLNVFHSDVFRPYPEADRVIIALPRGISKDSS
jgi:hypothetical protein